jgi:hypothetical protein
MFSYISSWGILGTPICPAPTISTLQGEAKAINSSNRFCRSGLLGFPVSTGKAALRPQRGGKEVKNLSSKVLIRLISLPGCEGERLWGLCLGGDVGEPPPQQLTVVNLYVSVMKLIAVAVSVVVVIKASLANS